MPLDLGGATLIDVDEASKGREEGPEAVAHVCKAQTLVAKSSMQVTMAATKVRAMVTKVKLAMALAAGTGEGGEVGSFATQESIPITSKVCLLRMERCLKLLEDFVPLEVKEEA